MYDVVILAGGFGSRLKSVSGHVIKPMVQICGKPVLEWQIELCKKNKLQKILMLVHHQYDQIIDYFGDGGRFGVEISYELEKSPRGTAGAILDAVDSLNGDFVVIYGDTIMDVDLQNILTFHDANAADITVFAHPNSHPQDSDLIIVGENDQITGFYKYPHSENLICRNLVNAALYVFKKSAISDVKFSNAQLDVVKDLFPALLNEGKRLFAYRSQEYIKDMGTPERLKKCIEDIESGMVAKLSSDKKREAIFLDRDGTIIKEVNFLKDHNQVELITTASKAIKLINESGMLSVVVTNQPVVARGDVTFEELDYIHAKMEFMLGNDGAYLDHISFCPHHPDIGFSGEIKELKINCNCRKPKTGMFEIACEKLNVDRRKSWMIGDTTTDILAGQNYGLRTVLVRTGHSGLDKKFNVEPDFIVADIFMGVNWIFKTQFSVFSQLDNMNKYLFDMCDVILIDGLPFNQKHNISKIIKEKIVQSDDGVMILNLQDNDLDTIIQAVEANYQKRQISIVCGLGAFQLEKLFHSEMRLYKIFCNIDLLSLWERAEACRKVAPFYERKFQELKKLGEMGDGIEPMVAEKFKQAHQVIQVI